MSLSEASPALPVHLQPLVDQLMRLHPAERRQVLEWVGSTPEREVVYANEAYRMLGLDRLKQPSVALQKLLNRGDLPRRKIGGKLVFHREELQRLIEHGSRRRRPGRPPGSKNKRPRRQPA